MTKTCLFRFLRFQEFPDLPKRNVGRAFDGVAVDARRDGGESLKGTSKRTSALSEGNKERRGGGHAIAPPSSSRCVLAHAPPRAEG